MPSFDDDCEESVEECEDQYCEVHWTTHYVEVERTVRFEMRVRNDDDGDVEATDVTTMMIEVRPPDDERVENFEDDGDNLTTETDEDRREAARRYREFLERQQQREEVGA